MARRYKDKMLRNEEDAGIPRRWVFVVNGTTKVVEASSYAEAREKINKEINS